MEKIKSSLTHKTLNAIIIGGSGATGRELIDLLVNSERYSSITIVTRRKIDRWLQYNQTILSKVDFIELESLDEILDFEKNPENYRNYFMNKKYDSLFCCLGSRVNKGETEFKKVDYNYVVGSAKLASLLSIFHYSVISTKAAHAKSLFLYLRVKGQADDDILKIDLPSISVYRPGSILERDNDCRWVEKIMRFVPFLDKISCRNLAVAIMNQDIYIHQKEINEKKIFLHSDIENLVNSRV